MKRLICIQMPFAFKKCVPPLLLAPQLLQQHQVVLCSRALVDLLDLFVGVGKGR